MCLTKREGDTLRAIRNFERRYGTPPTVRDIASAIGTKSVSFTHEKLEGLRDKGYIAWEPGKSRTIKSNPVFRTANGIELIEITLGEKR